MRDAALLVLVLLTSTDPAFAQGSPIRPGQRVRVTPPPRGARQVGRFAAMRGDTLVLVADTPLAYPLSQIDRLDVHRGTRSWTLVGAGIGLVLGAGAGVVFATRDWDFCRPCTTTIPVAIGVGGVLLGAGIGAVIKTDRWQPVPLEQLRTDPLATRHRQGVRAGLSVAF